MTDAALSAFSAPTRGWFEGVFAGPTAVQAEAWSAIARVTACRIHHVA